MEGPFFRHHRPYIYVQAHEEIGRNGKTNTRLLQVVINVAQRRWNAIGRQSAHDHTPLSLVNRGTNETNLKTSAAPGLPSNINSC
jgi:hypothetical protein